MHLLHTTAHQTIIITIIVMKWFYLNRPIAKRNCAQIIMFTVLAEMNVMLNKKIQPLLGKLKITSYQ